MNRWFVLCTIGLIGVPLCGCRSPKPHFEQRPQALGKSSLIAASTTNRINPEWLQPATNFFTLGPGDRLEIEVLGEPASRTTTLVGPDGKMYYYLSRGLDVWGMTLAQAKEELEKELLQYIRDNPKVSISVREVESKRVWLLGRLNSPGVYPLSAPMTLLEAISLAGGPANVGAGATLAGGGSVTISLGTGPEEAADLRRSFVMREGKLLPVDFYQLLKEGDVTQNIYLQPDDFIYVPSAVARNIYVLGAVAGPKAVPFVDQVTLISAVAAAGGTIKDAYLSHVAIVRGSLTQPQIAIINYKDVLQGKASDVVLEAHDIVYVPFTPYRIVSRYLDLILQTFVRTVGANEGARAIVSDAPPVGPNVPIFLSPRTGN